MNQQPTAHLPARLGWLALQITLTVEVVGGAIVLWNVVQGFISASNEPLGSRLSVLLAVLISWVWVAITLWGALMRRASWVRGSAITIHVLMFPAATGVLQGILGDAQVIGWTLLLLAIVGFVASVFARPIQANKNAGEPLS